MFTKGAKWNLNWEGDTGRNALSAVTRKARTLNTDSKDLKDSLNELICAMVTLGANGHNASADEKDYITKTLLES